MNIIITSAGQRVSLVRSFQTEIKLLGLESKVYTADLNPILAPACHVSYQSFEVPEVTDEEYIYKLLDLCTENNIKLVIPTIDTELMILSKSRSRFSDHGIHILVSDPSFIEKCRDKRKTNHLFLDHNIQVPKQYSVENLAYPVFVKPCDGSRSEGIFIAKDESDITDEHLNNKKLMFMEYISNKQYDEFTVDCYYDKYHDLKCVVPRQRLVVRAGEVNKALTRKNIIVDKFKENLSKVPGARGCLTIQVFLDKKNQVMKGIEINPRFGGGYPLTYLSGANYTKWVIKEYLLNQEVDEFYDWQNNLLMLRYDAEVLVNDYTN